jgi:hypothetical protein
MRRRHNVSKVATKAVDKVIAKAALRKGTVKVGAAKVAPVKVKARPSGRKLARKPREVAVHVQRFKVSIVDKSGAVKAELGPYLNQRAANIDAKSVLLKFASATATEEDGRDPVRTISAGSMRHTAKYPAGSGSRLRAAKRSGAGRGTYTEWRVAGDVAYQVGEGDTLRRSVVLKEAATMRMNGRKKNGKGAKRRKNTTDRSYKIVRMYLRGGKRTIATGLTLAQAQKHCNDPETSSTTAKSAKAKAVTRRMGPWFDGYEGGK